MAKKDRVNVNDFFSEVDQGQEVHTLKDQVSTLEAQVTEQSVKEAELIAEIEQLKRSQNSSSQNSSLDSAVGELRQHLEESYGKVQFPVAEIYRNEDQPRQSFTTEVQSMERSLQREGQLDPVILFPDGKLFDGECRWRAATSIGWESLEAVFIPDMDGPSLRRKAYLTSLHRQTLNALDRAEALVAIICDCTDIDAAEVPKSLNRVLTRLKRQKITLTPGIELLSSEEQENELTQLQLTAEEKSVFLILLGLQENPASLSRNIFPMLSLQYDLKEAVREKGLPCPQASILNTISEKSKKLNITSVQAKKLRTTGIKAILESSLSIAETKKWVKENTAQYSLTQLDIGAAHQSHIQPIVERMNTLAQRIGSSVVDSRITEKLAAIDAILSEIESIR